MTFMPIPLGKHSTVIYNEVVSKRERTPAMTRTFTTRTDIDNELRWALEAGGEVTDAEAEYDFDAIADACYTYDSARGGFIQTATEEEWWDAVIAAAR